RAIWSTMWSRNGTPVASVWRPVPSRSIATRMRVSAVLRETSARLFTMDLRLAARLAEGGPRYRATGPRIVPAEPACRPAGAVRGSGPRRPAHPHAGALGMRRQALAVGQGRRQLAQRPRRRRGHADQAGALLEIVDPQRRGEARRAHGRQ